MKIRREAMLLGMIFFITAVLHSLSLGVIGRFCHVWLACRRYTVYLCLYTGISGMIVFVGGTLLVRFLNGCWSCRHRDERKVALLVFFVCWAICIALTALIMWQSWESYIKSEIADWWWAIPFGLLIPGKWGVEFYWRTLHCRKF